MEKALAELMAAAGCRVVNVVASRRPLDAERFAKTRDFLDIQLREARWWRDASLAYFMQRSGRGLPPGTRPPAESLEYYRSLEFPHAPGW
jgi:alpha-glucuronidase